MDSFLWANCCEHNIPLDSLKSAVAHSLYDHEFYVLAERANEGIEAAKLKARVQLQKAKVSKTPWSAGESSAALNFFSTSIKKGKVPGKSDVEACIKAHPILKNRTWKVVKDFVRNHIVKLAKMQK